MYLKGPFFVCLYKGRGFRPLKQLPPNFRLRPCHTSSCMSTRWTIKRNTRQCAVLFSMVFPGSISLFIFNVYKRSFVIIIVKKKPFWSREKKKSNNNNLPIVIFVRTSVRFGTQVCKYARFCEIVNNNYRFRIIAADATRRGCVLILYHIKCGVLSSTTISNRILWNLFETAFEKKKQPINRPQGRFEYNFIPVVWQCVIPSFVLHSFYSEHVTDNQIFKDNL